MGASAPGGTHAPSSEVCILAPRAPLATTGSKDSVGGVLLYRAAVNVCVFACVWLFVLVHLRSSLSPSNLQVSDQRGPGTTLTTEFQASCSSAVSRDQAGGSPGTPGRSLLLAAGEEMLTQAVLHNHQEEAGG